MGKHLENVIVITFNRAKVPCLKITMIVRPQQHWLRRIFVWHGSVLSKIFSRLLLNFLFSIAVLIILPWYTHLFILYVGQQQTAAEMPAVSARSPAADTAPPASDGSVQENAVVRSRSNPATMDVSQWR